MTLQTVTHIMPMPHKSFKYIQEATAGQIHCTHGAISRWMAGIGRKRLQAKYHSTCACCGGSIVAGDWILWTPKGEKVIHDSSQTCVARAESVRKTAQVLARNEAMYQLKGQLQSHYRRYMGFENQPGLLTQLALPAPKTRGNINKAVTPAVICL